ncbi:MAG: chemotaxis protein CheD [Pseudomonadota bacterium]
MPQLIHITQGEHAVSAEADVTITTLLGSCVACCIWDPVAGLGGMNHMLLARTGFTGRLSNRSGVAEMETLINEIVERGGVRTRLRAKAFGGAHMVSGLSDIGPQNAAFALDYLAQEGIFCEASSLGGLSARLVRFWPATGRVQQKRTSDVPRDRLAGGIARQNGPELF